MLYCYVKSWVYDVLVAFIVWTFKPVFGNHVVKFGPKGFSYIDVLRGASFSHINILGVTCWRYEGSIAKLYWSRAIAFFRQPKVRLNAMKPKVCRNCGKVYQTRNGVNWLSQERSCCSGDCALEYVMQAKRPAW